MFFTYCISIMGGVFLSVLFNILSFKGLVSVFVVFGWIFKEFYCLFCFLRCFHVVVSFLGICFGTFLSFIYVLFTAFFRSLFVTAISFIWLLNLLQASCDSWKSAVICCVSMGGLAGNIGVGYLISSFVWKFVGPLCV